MDRPVATCKICKLKWTDRAGECPEEDCSFKLVAGDKVRAQAPSLGTVQGWIVNESHGGKCWLLQTSKGLKHYNKCYCVKIRRNEMSKTARRLG